MFQGYCDETFEFFMAIRFNNNPDFFHANHDWYRRSVRAPSLALAEALNAAVEQLDDTLERRPNRVVSRINRDIRYSHDKSPYRDYLWLAFRPPDRENDLGLYFDLSASGGSYGMGLYRRNRPYMNGLRLRLAQSPEQFASLLDSAAGEFTLHADLYRRMRVPDNIPEELRTLYLAKSFCFSKTLTDFSMLKSPALADEIIRGFRLLQPLYRVLADVKPLEDDPIPAPRPPQNHLRIDERSSLWVPETILPIIHG